MQNTKLYNNKYWQYMNDNNFKNLNHFASTNNKHATHIKTQTKQNLSETYMST